MRVLLRVFVRVFVLLGMVLTAACGDGYFGRHVQVVFAPESATPELSLTGPIVTERFPASVAESTHTDASLFVIDLTDGALTFRQLVGIMATYDAPTLTVSATVAAAPCGSTHFAFVILDNVRDAQSNMRIGRSQAFNDAFESPGELGPLRAALVDAGVELASVAGAALFDTAAVSCP